MIIIKNEIYSKNMLRNYKIRKCIKLYESVMNSINCTKLLSIHFRKGYGNVINSINCMKFYNINCMKI